MFSFVRRTRVAVAVITLALSLAACGTTTPSPNPASHSAVASGTQAASPVDALRIDDAAYRAGDPFPVPTGDAGADWAAPSALPVMPNGQPAARVALLPASCAGGDVTITADPPPDDAWETVLREDGAKYHFELMTWPSAQLPQCANGPGPTYLQVAYRPFVPLGTIHLVVSTTNVDSARSSVDVVPVFTSADATQPSLTGVGSVSSLPVSGPEKPRSAKAELMSAEGFAVTSLPDGTTPTQWGLRVTGCGPVGGKRIVITVRIGGAAPVEVGSCADGGLTNDRMSLPLPADGTRFVVYRAGGTTKSRVRVSEFQWRGARP